MSDQETLERKAVDLEALLTVARAPSMGTPSPAALGPALEPGCLFGPYRVVRALGAGGFGQVWEAESLATGRRLALKILTAAATASSEEVERFKREGRLAASLSHPHCVYVLSAEEIQGFPVITMELMTGGTLADKLRNEGPIPYRLAVDFALQIAEGLEAASRAGVIHRDVKPSNCFLDGKGAVRVGDFGLSKTLERDPHLTTTGSFLGTPSYSSPEQVRGRDVDFRTDLYSLGATLYALLTGRPPFSGGGTEVLARILSEPPEPFGREATVPRGLQQIVERLLAKDKARRYSGYGALRDALLPYSSRGLAPGDVGRRAGAILADLTLCNLAVVLLAGSRLLSQPIPSEIAYGLLLLAYFTLLEGLWGQSLGKRLFGLRVVTTSAGPVSFLHALARSSVFAAALSLPPVLWLACLSPAAAFQAMVRSPALPVASELLAPMALLLSTMRRRNGYAALHDLITRTRVMAVDAAVSRLPLVLGPDHGRTASEAPRHFGPYRELHPIWDKGTESLLLARDDELQRTVWIHRYADEPAGSSPAELAVVRPGRLHWLQGSRAGTEKWDAYEAPSGIAFCERIRSAGALSWAELRHVLLDVATELASREAEGRGTALLRSSRVWLSGDGGAKLLDFNPTRADDGTAMDWRELVQHLLARGLVGTAVPPSERTNRPPLVPLPEHARTLVGRCFGAGEPFASAAELRDALALAAHRSASISRARRAACLAAIAFVPAVLATTAVVMGTGEVPTAHRFLGDSRTALRRLGSLPGEPERQSARAEIQILQAHGYATLLSHASDEAFGYERALAELTLAELSAGDRQSLEAALRDHPSPSAAEVARARARLDALAPPKPPALVALVAVLMTLLLAATLGLLLAPIVRGAPLLALFGIAVQSVEGERAGRLRCLLRAALAWGLWILLALIQLGAFFPGQPRPVLQVLAPLMVVSAVVVALAWPDRTLPDLIARTRLVPR